MTYMDVYLGLGSNLDKPLTQLKTAIKRIASLPNIKPIKQASVYETRPVDGSIQANYYNTALHITTCISPKQLLTILKTIEKKHGRKISCRWGPRPLDIDILLYGQSQLDTLELTIPHPELKKRDFALIPLLEINSKLQLPSGECLFDYLENCNKTIIRKLSETS